MSARVPIYLQVAQLLDARIERGEYAVGGYLPPERDLARELGVNRAATRIDPSLLASGIEEGMSLYLS